MRKLLLAGAAMLSGTVGLAGIASAQNYPTVTVNTDSGGSLTPVPQKGTAGTFGTDIPGFGPPLSPGEITVRLAGRLVVYAGVASDSGRNAAFVNGTATNPGTPTNNKLAPYSIGSYARIYPQVDGIAANGLKYGAFLEIRADQAGPAGGGANGSVGASHYTRGELYWWRQTIYLGTDRAGFVRVGSTDQPTSLFVTGTFENFDDGGWNSNVYNGFPITSSTQVNGPFPDISSLYATNKIVYVSPKFANLVDFGVSFAPNTGTTSPAPGSASSNYSTTGGADTASSSAVIGEQKRPRNTIDAVVRLRTATGPIGIAATVGGYYSGYVNYNGAEPSTVVPRYNGYAVFDTGAQITYGGLAFGGHLDYGQVNNATGTWALQPQGGRDYLGWLVGSSYQFGSAVVGFQYFLTQGAGYWTSAVNQGSAASSGVGRTLSQTGFAAGGTLTLAPGLYTFLSYLYGEKHQSGVDLLTGTPTANGNLPYVTHNNTNAQALIIGTRVAW
jgi:hypothetical protein